LISEEDGTLLFISVTVLNVLFRSHCICDTYRIASDNSFLFIVFSTAMPFIIIIVLYYYVIVLI
jgi:hypothetical protein